MNHPLSKIFAAGYQGNLLAILSGIMLTLAFAPYDYFIFAVFAPAVLLGLWLNTSPRLGFIRGLLFGLGYFGSGVYWIFNSIHDFGGTSLEFSTFITVTVILYLALYPALVGYSLNRYFPAPSTSKIFLAFPAIWVISEWLRSMLFTGLPCLLLGNSQVASPLKGYAPLLGVYGISLILLLCSSTLLHLFTVKNRRIAIISLSALVTIWSLGGLLSYIPWTKPDGNTTTISLVQGNIENSVKWSNETTYAQIEKYISLSEPQWGNSHIIVWPETAVPIPVQYAGELLLGLNKIAKQSHTAFVTGIPLLAENKQSYYNAIIALGDARGVYQKRKLVPFGEYTPFGTYLKRIVTSLNIPMSDFVAGHYIPHRLTLAGIQVSATICYESAFPELALDRSEDTGMLLTISNDGWFGHSTAAAQHLQTAQMRALEMQRPALFVTNSGVTAIIAPNGAIQASLRPYTEGVLTSLVQARTGLTPWQRYAMTPVLIILILMMIFAIRARKQ